jgi:5-oxoprolinase (ATP-hydrolysing) subunit A
MCMMASCEGQGKAVPVVDLVADLGESFGPWTMGNDAELLNMLTSANIACGFHGGDPRVMDRTVADCVARGVGIGAHPSFPDLVGFGRRAMDLTEDEVQLLIWATRSRNSWASWPSSLSSAV